MNFIDISHGVKVAGFHYSVVTDEEATKDCRNNDRYGSCSFQFNKILVDATYPAPRVSETFLHEVIEAINQHYLIKLRHDQITQLGVGLHQAMESLDVRFGVGK